MIPLFYYSHFLLSGSLIIIAVTGDQLVSKSQTDWQRAIADNSTHGIIGLITWLIISLVLNQDYAHRYFEVILCGLLASLIDVDHFLVAHSTNLQDARNLPARPFLHCTSMTLAPCVILILVAWLIKSNVLHWFAWLLIAALTSHHTRDATRRGFWLWPLGSTPPVPYALYVGCIALLPHLLVHGICITNPDAPHKNTVSIV